MNRSIFLCLIFIYLLSTIAVGQVSTGEKGKIKGTVYSDFYWMARNHDENIEGQNGFWFRRIYFTYEHQFSSSFSSRFRLEAANPGDFQSSTTMVPDVKDAYLKWKNDNHQIFAGISSTPTFSLTEDVWGYRSVEKAPQDLYNFGSSRDLGLSFKGQIDGGGKWNYHFFVGNGNGNKSEFNKGKKLMFSLAYNLTDHLVVQGYVDWNDSAGSPNGQNSYTFQGFAGYQSKKFNLGALYSYQNREPEIGVGDIELDLISLFTNISFNDMVSGYLRADHLFDGYPGGVNNSYVPFAPGVESTFLIGGADILLEENIHLLPNIEAVIYGQGTLGNSPQTDVIPRLTLFYEF